MNTPAYPTFATKYAPQPQAAMAPEPTQAGVNAAIPTPAQPTSPWMAMNNFQGNGASGQAAPPMQATPEAMPLGFNQPTPQWAYEGK